MTVKAYCGCKMTGLDCAPMIDAAQHLAHVLYEYGIEPYHPVLKEAIPYVNEPLKERSPEEMNQIWLDDKQAVRESHVILDTAPHLFSAGLKQEVGKARYRDWKPVVAIFPEGFDMSKVSFITKAEYDYVTNSIEDAAECIQTMWGTKLQRMMWRLPIYSRHLLDLSVRKLIQFFY